MRYPLSSRDNYACYRFDDQKIGKIINSINMKDERIILFYKNLIHLIFSFN